MKLRTALILVLILSLHLWGCRKETGSEETRPEINKSQIEQKVPLTKFKDGYVEVKGGRLWYRMIGSGDGTPVITIHGGPGGTHRSFYQFEPISEDRPLILFDQLGSGKSTRHQETTLLSVDNFVEQVHALRQALGLKEVFLHGHSWGTALALECYLKHPEGVKGIVFNSPYFNTEIWEADADTLITYLPDSIQAAIETGEREGNFTSRSYQEANRVFLSKYGRRKPKPSNPWDSVKAERNDFIYNYMWGPTEFTATGTLKNYDRYASLKEIEVPVLFITGEFDEARPETVRRYQGEVKNSEFVIIEGAGHATMHDNREQNVQVIREFLNRTDR